MKIKNFDALAKNNLRKNALQILEAGYQAIDTDYCIRKEVNFDGETLRVRDWSANINDLGKIIIVGIGKCSSEAALALEDILGEKISNGVIIDVKQGAILRRIKAYKGSHPLPSSENVIAAKSIVELLQGLTEKDLVLFVISGGGSTLLCLPEDRGCEEELSVVETLIKSGATIQEINTVRKHLSLARGGYLAKYAYPAKLVSLIFSDVPGNDVQFIASGPTVKDETTIEDAERILEKYNVLITCGIEKCGLVETPKEDKYFENAKHMIIVSNEVALAAMEEKAKELGFNPSVRSTALVGETKSVAEEVARELNAAPAKTAHLYGGETTVVVKGGGRGGRNMEFALASLHHLGMNELVLAAASDGRDNSDRAGGLCDTITKEEAQTLHLDVNTYLDENNEYPFFEKVGDYLQTGDTGSNVSDLIIAIKE